MVTGVGVDILSIDRMRQQLDSPAFMSRVFTSTELKAGTCRPDPATYYAKVFAAKEAVFKCFGIRADELGTWLNIEIADSEEAQPEVELNGVMAERAKERNVGRVLLSLSSDTDYAVAFAAVVREVRNGE